MSPARKRLLKVAVVLLQGAVILAVLAFARARLERPSGMELNTAAWEASYRERGLPVPPDGPRDGYWGRRMPRMVRDAKIGWREAEAHLRPFAETDDSGMQVVPAPEGAAALHVLVLGGSVAWGAYASDIEHTYFHRLAAALADSGQPARITVLAAGAWDSENELLALQSRGLKVRPDVVVVLNGNNDLTQSGHRHRKKLGKPEIAREDRVGRYLANMRQVRDLAISRRIPLLFVLQPSPLTKERTPLEQRAVELTLRGAGLSEEYMLRSLDEIRRGLSVLARAPGTVFVDASTAFARERPTTFADIAHFSDPGHALLAEAIARPLSHVLASVPRAASASR